VVDHQAVPIGISEDRAVADTGVEGLALELDAGLLEASALRVGTFGTRNASEPKGSGAKSRPISSGTTIASVTLPVSNSTQVSEDFGLRSRPSVSP